MGLGVIIAGIIVFALGFPLHMMLRKKSTAVLAWPTVPGVVADAYMKKYTVGGTQGSTQHEMFWVVYDYTIGGTTFHGENRPEDCTAADFTTRYAKGAPVEVRYDPQHPERGRVGFTGKGLSLAILPWILGAFLAFIGMLMRIGEHRHH